MPRIFLPDSELKPGTITIRGDKARYLTAVLRCETGDLLTLSDAKGNAYTARITGKTPKEVSADIIEQVHIDTESPLRVTLIQAVLKGEKMDLVVQKATELGVVSIVPVLTERSQVRETRKVPRWKKIAEEASRQSGRNTIPDICETVDMENLFLGPSAIADGGIIFWEQGGVIIPEAIRTFRSQNKISLFTGPEGGFSEREIQTASRHGFVTATLGRRILRAETAAIAAVSVIQYALGDLGNGANSFTSSHNRV